MKLKSLTLTAFMSLYFAVLIIAAPAAAVTIFSNGFEDGTLCAWGPSGCATLALVDVTAISPVSGHEEWADYVVKYTLHAGGRDLWFEKEAERSVSPNLTKGFWFSIENGSTGSTYTGGITPFWMSASCPAPCQDTPTHFKVGANTTKTFWLRVRLDNNGGVVGFYRMKVTGLAYKFDGNNGDAVTLITAIPANFVTPSIFVQNVNNVGGPNAYEDFHSKNHL